MTGMEAALRLVAEGVIEVRQDGTIWKLRNLGRVPLSAPRRMETLAKNGYLLVKIWVDGKQYAVWAHRLSWTVLRGTIPAGMEMNHLDGVTTRNHPDNLEPVTGSQNKLHSYRALGRLPPKTIPPRILERVAPAARRLREQGMSYAMVARELGVSQTTAFRACQT